MENIYVARQPIFDKNRQIFGYELLYSEAGLDLADSWDEDLVSSQVIINSFLDIGMENLVGSNLAFLAISKSFIVDGELLPIAPEQVVLEIMENVSADEKVIKGLSRLSERGYRLALKGFSDGAGQQDMLDIVDMVKLDLTKSGGDELKQKVKMLRARDLTLIAKKVETPEQYEMCKELGFDYFQGHYFSHPNTVKSKNIAVNKAIVFQVIEKLQHEDTSMDELEKLLVQDVSLTYKLMRYINSASFAFRKEIESVKQALIILGTDTIKNWATLIVLSNVNTDKPFEIFRTALVRAKMGECLAAKTGQADKNQMFTVGLFSLLDGVMDMEMIDLLDTISLTAPIKMALLDGEGELGDLLNQVIAYEQGDWPALKKKSDNPAIYKECYIEALRWADEISKSIRS